MKNISDKYSAFIFDLDGTIYRGSRIIENAGKTINELKNLKKKLIFVSNKTTGTVKDYFKFLKDGGLNIEEDEIINSTLVIQKYLAQNLSGAKFFAIGEQNFINEISNCGLTFSDNAKEIEILIVTLDRTITYQKLETAARALESGAKFFAANIDDTCPVDEGEVIDAGSTISALEKRTHRKLELHFGKPSQFMFDEIKNRLNVDISEVLLVGDRLETDIAMGNKFGVHTALVNTGVKYYPNGTENIKPTYHLNSVFDLLNTNI